MDSNTERSTYGLFKCHIYRVQNVILLCLFLSEFGPTFVISYPTTFGLSCSDNYCIV